jgi:glycosyltransferase involved in cell wall biosynthesis
MGSEFWSLVLSGTLAAYIALKIGYESYRYHGFSQAASSANEDELPTVSVCIPARNEMHALEQCLEYILASDYGKLEVLVLDDSSSDQTPHIIRSFAHAGVRFIPGSPLPKGWLGKNHALATLAEAASGDYILFLDVDAHIDVKTIRRLVATAATTGAKMISVMPRRDDMHHASAIFGTARHMWELVLARKKSPPSSSTFWLIQREVLQQLDTRLSDYGASVRPDHHIASILSKQGVYRYYVGTPYIGVRYEKRLHSQVETAERLYFAMLSMSWLLVALVLAASVILVLPYFYLRATHWTLALLAIGLQYAAFSLFTVSTSVSGPGVILRMFSWPYVFVQDVVLLMFSVLRYTTNHVAWKGRNVTEQQRSTWVEIDE